MSASVAVIGTIFVDCKGFAQSKYLAESRNLGSIRFVHGGVGRNVAENLAGLGVPVALVSTVDQSGLGSEVLDRLSARVVQVDEVLRLTERGMGMWLAILDETGNLAGSISQMPELGALEEHLRVRADALVQRRDHIVLELDLTEPISRLVRQAAVKAGKPVYGIPGNLDVVQRHPELLEGLACFICNHHEAGRLLGRDLEAEVERAGAIVGAAADGEAEGAMAGAAAESETAGAIAGAVAKSETAGAIAGPETASAARALGSPYASLLEELRAYVDRAGLHSIVITLGAQGALYCDAHTGSSGHQPALPVRMVDSSGAGDAFFSGTVTGLIRGLRLAEAVRLGTQVAAWTIESAENTCPDLRDKLRQQTGFGEL